MDEILELLMCDPEKLTPTVKGYIDKYKPTIYKLMQEVVDVYRDYSNNNEYPAIVAKTKKNMYDAYLKVGFTEDQSLALMIHDNIQLMNNIKKISSSSSTKKSSTKKRTEFL